MRSSARPPAFRSAMRTSCARISALSCSFALFANRTLASSFLTCSKSEQAKASVRLSSPISPSASAENRAALSASDSLLARSSSRRDFSRSATSLAAFASANSCRASRASRCSASVARSTSARCPARISWRILSNPLSTSGAAAASITARGMPPHCCAASCAACTLIVRAAVLAASRAAASTFCIASASTFLISAAAMAAFIPTRSSASRLNSCRSKWCSTLVRASHSSRACWIANSCVLSIRAVHSLVS
mmetsp:Transcript_4988/g.12685  ORF Transcript_4988/g.12685 Transcript_4988/m.12685 type:complete len:250 (+) Transcript_4988:331-1080(+)